MGKKRERKEKKLSINCSKFKNKVVDYVAHLKYDQNCCFSVHMTYVYGIWCFLLYIVLSSNSPSLV